MLGDDLCRFTNVVKLFDAHHNRIASSPLCFAWVSPFHWG
jgi:hypothetical protein